MIVLPSCSPAVRLDYSFSCLLQFGFFLLDRVKYDNWDFFVFFTISQANSINSHWRPAGFCSDRGRLSNHSVAPLCHEVTEEWSTLLLVITHADSRKQIQKTEKQKMANLPVQLLAYLTALIGGLLMIVAVILPFWKEPDFEVSRLAILLVHN